MQKCANIFHSPKPSRIWRSGITYLLLTKGHFICHEFPSQVILLFSYQKVASIAVSGFHARLLSDSNPIHSTTVSLTHSTHTCPQSANKSSKRVTFSYLVSRVTRKKLSSGASIQLGRLLRIIIPPLVFPPVLLRPLCCKKQLIVHLLE